MATYTLLGSPCYCWNLVRFTLKILVLSATRMLLEASQMLKGRVFLVHVNELVLKRSIHRKQRGRLKVCSESILFDPVEFSDPVIKVYWHVVISRLKLRNCQCNRLPSEIARTYTSGAHLMGWWGGCVYFQCTCVWMCILLCTCRGGDVFVVEATQLTQMLEANVMAPYKFRKVHVHGWPKASVGGQWLMLLCNL